MKEKTDEIQKLQQPHLQQPEDINSSEPLMSTVDVLGWKAPEKVYETTQAEEDVKQAIKDSRTPYQIWQEDPSQDNLYKVVKHLQPTIQSSLASIGGTDPNIRSKARVVAAKSVMSYDPSSGASLPTWVSSQLRQLTRDVRKSNNVLSIPENAQLDAYHLYRVEVDLEDELGRPPTVEEIADKAAMSVKKIQQIRKKVRAVATEGNFEADDGSTALVNSNADYSQEAIDYVYNDSDLKDKQLIEHLMGYGGADVWDNKTIMSKLRLTPVQLSRRKMRLGKRIQNIVSDLESL